MSRNRTLAEWKKLFFAIEKFDSNVQLIVLWAAGEMVDLSMSYRLPKLFQSLLISFFSRNTYISISVGSQ